MHWFLDHLITLAIGFAGGWAFFKHRTAIKAAAVAEANSLRNSAASAISPKK